MGSGLTPCEAEVSEVGQVYADLMLPAGIDANFHQRQITARLQRSIMGCRQFGTGQGAMMNINLP